MYFKDKQLEALLNKCTLVIFDLNGLIIDDEPVQLASFNKALEQFHIELDEQYWIDKCVGRKSKEIFETLIAENNFENSNGLVERLLSEKISYYGEFILEVIHDIEREGARDLLHYVASQDYWKVGLATSTNKTELDLMLGSKGLGIAKYFDYCITGDEVTIGKPHPEIFLRVAETFHIYPSKCLVLEDTNAGVESATAAGMRCLAVPNRFTIKHDFSKATYTIDSLLSEAKTL